MTDNADPYQDEMKDLKAIKEIMNKNNVKPAVPAEPLDGRCNNLGHKAGRPEKCRDR